MDGSMGMLTSYGLWTCKHRLCQFLGKYMCLIASACFSLYPLSLVPFLFHFRSCLLLSCLVKGSGRAHLIALEL